MSGCDGAVERPCGVGARADVVMCAVPSGFLFVVIALLITVFMSLICNFAKPSNQILTCISTQCGAMK